MGTKTKTNGDGVIDLKNQKRGFSVKEVAEETTLSEDYVRVLIRRGVLPATHIGKRWVVLAKDLDTLLHRGAPMETK